MQGLFWVQSLPCAEGMLGEGPQGSGQKQRLWLAVYQSVGFKWWFTTCSKRGTGHGLIPFPRGPLSTTPRVWKSSGLQRGGWYKFVSGVLALKQRLREHWKGDNPENLWFFIVVKLQGSFPVTQLRVSPGDGKDTGDTSLLWLLFQHRARHEHSGQRNSTVFSSVERH